MKWFHKFQPVVNWSRHTLSIHDNVSQPVMIRGEAGIPSLPLISHIQAKRELRRGAQAAIIYVNPKAKDLGIPQRYGELFDRFNDLFLQDDLPPELPPERPEDHVIDLVDGAEPVSKFPYRLNKVHEEELERQLGELLDRGFIRPSVSPFAAPILFVRKNYSVYDKALLAVINALKHWKHFLYGRDFTVRTDHQALRWLQSMPSANWSDRQARWSQYFEQFGGMIEYIPGIANPVADALSRKSHVSHLERQSFLSIEGIGLEDMKNNYASSAEFSSQWLQALEAPGPCNYMIRDAGFFTRTGYACCGHTGQQCCTMPMMP